MYLKDYIQYYLHCDFYLTKRNIKTRITNYWPMQDQDNEHCVGYGLDGDNGVEDIRYIKPILCKLEDINDEVLVKLINKLSLYDLSICTYESGIDDDGYWINAIKNGSVIDSVFITEGVVEVMDNHGNMYAYQNQAITMDVLIKSHFDLFGLIDAGLAIDSKTLK